MTRTREENAEDLELDSKFMKFGTALEIVLDLARQNVADQLDHPDFYKKHQLAIDVVEDWGTNNLAEDD